MAVLRETQGRCDPPNKLQVTKKVTYITLGNESENLKGVIQSDIGCLLVSLVDPWHEVADLGSTIYRQILRGH